MGELGHVLLKHPHVGILTDDIYEHLVFDDFKFATIAAVVPRLDDRTLTVNGVSKAYCMTGWRIGYGAGPLQLIKTMATLQSQSTLNPSSISQAAAVEALSGPQDVIARINEVFRQRRDAVVDMLNKARDLHCPRPNSAFYVYPSCAGFIGRTTPQGKRIAAHGSPRTPNDLAGQAIVTLTRVTNLFVRSFVIAPHFRR